MPSYFSAHRFLRRVSSAAVVSLLLLCLIPTPASAVSLARIVR